MADDQAVSRMLGTLYAAPTAPELWRDFLHGLCDSVGATNAALIAHDTETNEHRVFGWFGDSIEQSADLYAERYWEFDEWTRRGIPRLATHKVLIGSEVWPEPEFLRSVFYNEFLKQFDLDICSVASIGMGSIPGKFDGLSIFRGHSDQEFTAENTAVLSMLQTHLEIALATRRRLSALQSKVADLENAFNSIDSAVVLLDAAGRVLLLNAAAYSILNRGDGLYLSKSKTITTRRSCESAKLIELIFKAIATAKGKGHFGGGVMPFPRPGKRPLQLLVSPLCSESAGRAVVAVFLADPEQNQAVPTDVLRTLFGLTPAEARLALSVLEGNSLSEAAELNRVSRETVKSQMSAVFAKTGTRRQGELVRLLSRVPVLKDSTVC
jgi:DNA-binding CsgD family transcriptional regulator/histidinol phosphatase-like PHP family hydrolase